MRFVIKLKTRIVLRADMHVFQLCQDVTLGPGIPTVPANSTIFDPRYRSGFCVALGEFVTERRLDGFSFLVGDVKKFQVDSG